MDADIKAKWCEALRSGKYHQGTGQLRYNQPDVGVCHCCLGVLADVAAPEGFLDEHGMAGYLHESVDFRLPEGAILAMETQMTLVDMNDSGGYTFNQIADYIEENL